MFMRQSVLTRYLIAMLVGAMCVWFWNMLVSSSPVQTITNQVQDADISGILFVHLNTIYRSVSELPPQSTMPT